MLLIKSLLLMLLFFPFFFISSQKLQVKFQEALLKERKSGQHAVRRELSIIPWLDSLSGICHPNSNFFQLIIFFRIFQKNIFLVVGNINPNIYHWARLTYGRP